MTDRFDQSFDFLVMISLFGLSFLLILTDLVTYA